MASNQTAALQSKLNTGLPTIMNQFGVKHVSGNMSSNMNAARTRKAGQT